MDNNIPGTRPHMEESTHDGKIWSTTHVDLFLL